MTDPNPGQQPHGSTPSYGSTPAAPPASGAAYGQPVPGQGDKKTLGLTSLILGIVGVVFSFLVSFVGLLLGVAAIVLAVLSRKREPAGRGMALGGLITGIVAVVLAIALIIIAIVALSALGGLPQQP